MNILQEPPGLCVPGHVTLPTNIRMVEIPYKNKCWGSQGYFQMFVKCFIHFLHREAEGAGISRRMQEVLSQAHGNIIFSEESSQDPTVQLGGFSTQFTKKTAFPGPSLSQGAPFPPSIKPLPLWCCLFCLKPRGVLERQAALMERMLGELGGGLFFLTPLPRRLQQVGSEGRGKGQRNIVFYTFQVRLNDNNGKLFL